MFFIQRQLSENTCGHWTEVLAYFSLKADSTAPAVNWRSLTNPHQTKFI